MSLWTNKDKELPDKFAQYFENKIMQITTRVNIDKNMQNYYYWQEFYDVKFT